MKNRNAMSCIYVFNNTDTTDSYALMIYVCYFIKKHAKRGHGSRPHILWSSYGQGYVPKVAYFRFSTHYQNRYVAIVSLEVAKRH